MLQADPVVQGAHVVAEVQFAGGPHAAQHAFALIRFWIHWVDCTETTRCESSKMRKKPSTGLIMAMVTRPPKKSMIRKLRYAEPVVDWAAS